MAAKNSIQILRGTSSARANHNETSLIGQPLYETDTNKLYVGDGATPLSELNAIVASHSETANHATTANRANYASSAGSALSATYADTRNRLYFNGDGVSVSWNGSSQKTIYVPTSPGSIGQVWGIKSSGNVGWINQTEIPGTIEHANTANFATTASTLNQILPANLGGTGTDALNKALADMIQASNTITSTSINNNCYFPIATNNALTSSRISYEELKDAFTPTVVGKSPRIVGMVTDSNEIAIRQYYNSATDKFYYFVESINGGDIILRLKNQDGVGDKDITMNGRENSDNAIQRAIMYKSGNTSVAVKVVETNGEVTYKGINENLSLYNTVNIATSTNGTLIVTDYA